MGSLQSHNSIPTSAYGYNRESEKVSLGNKEDLCCPNGVAIGERFVFVAEGGADEIARVSVFSKSGEFVTSFSNEYMACPWSIEVHRDNLYLTDTATDSVLHFADDEGYCVCRKVGGRGTGDTEFNYPIQVSVSARGEVYVADKFNDRVQILDSGLEYLRSITHPTMSAPIGVRVITEGVYVLSSSLESCILHLFSVTGDKQSCRIPNNSISNTEESIAHNTRFPLDDRNSVIVTRVDQLLGNGNKEESVRTVMAKNKPGILHYVKTIKKCLVRLKISH